jgi:XTP/dITP diphosphohydrolase
MSTRPSIIVASRNRKKVGEILELLAPFGFHIASVGEFPDAPEVDESGNTFSENAAKKAREIAQHLSAWTIGEDSGLSVDALGGAPGIYSARYSDPGATDERNNEKLQRELASVPPEKRTAAYTCSIALADPSGEIRVQCEDYCRGRIIGEPRGSNGFGYDPYFLIPEYHQTFGELASAVKQQISHRARAFHRFIPQVVKLFANAEAGLLSSKK